MGSCLKTPHDLGTVDVGTQGPKGYRHSSSKSTRTPLSTPGIISLHTDGLLGLLESTSQCVTKATRAGNRRSCPGLPAGYNRMNVLRVVVGWYLTYRNVLVVVMGYLCRWCTLPGPPGPFNGRRKRKTSIIIRSPWLLTHAFCFHNKSTTIPTPITPRLALLLIKIRQFL